jgi:hypothetical protein
MSRKSSNVEREESLTWLRAHLTPGTRVYCVLRHVSASGMSRRIDFYIILDGEMCFISGYVADVLGLRRHPSKDGLTVTGCGMDMGFHVVYELGRALYPKGFKVEGRGRNGDTSGWDNDGGYALKSEWV